jgi:hypothetical protein
MSAATAHTARRDDHARAGGPCPSTMHRRPYPAPRAHRKPRGLGPARPATQAHGWRLARPDAGGPLRRQQPVVGRLHRQLAVGRHDRRGALSKTWGLNGRTLLARMTAPTQPTLAVCAPQAARYAARPAGRALPRRPPAVPPLAVAHRARHSLGPARPAVQERGRGVASPDADSQFRPPAGRGESATGRCPRRRPSCAAWAHGARRR